jgi:Uma2 family endonuclease
MCALPLEQEIEYPDSDGQPMAETTLHRMVMSDMIEGLERHYTDTADVWVGGNLLLYYRKGDRRKSVSPDVLLARGIEKWPRRTYLLWQEKPPALIFEITSQSTADHDTGFKKDLYERLGVAELVLFDPYAEYLEPRLQGYRLERGRYKPLPLNRDGSLDLQTVGMTARPEGERLRLVDTVTGEALLWNDELEAARHLAEERATEAEEGQRLAEEGQRLAEERQRLAEEARRLAEERVVAEAAARRSAEERGAQEAAARRAAEERARALAEEVARLRRESKP